MNTKTSLTLRLCLIAVAGTSIASASAQIAYTRLQPNGTVKLHRMRADGTADVTINAPFTKLAFPTWSPGGRQLAYAAFEPTNLPVHTWNVFGRIMSNGVLRKLTDYHDILDPNNTSFSYTFPLYKAFSRDSLRLATFSLTQTGGPGSQGGGGVVDLPVLEIHSLTSAANPILVAVDKTKNGRHHGGEGVDWAPNQAKLAAPLETSAPYLSGGGPGEVTAIFLIPPTLAAVQNGLARQVTFPRTDANIGTGLLWSEHDYAPKFSPNGVRVAYVRSFQSHALLTSPNPDPDIQSLYIVNLNTHVETEVHRFPQGTYISALDWSPDGTRLVFDLAQQVLNSPVGPLQQPRPETNQIYIINTNGTGLRQVRGNGNGNPSWKR